MSSKLNLELPDFSMTFLGREAGVERQRTPKRDECQYQDARWRLAGPGQLSLTLVAREFENGEKSYQAVERHASPERFNVLIDRCRMGVETMGEVTHCSLRTVLLKEQQSHANLFDRDWSALDQCAGFDVRHWLYLMGASAAGTKEEVLGDTGRSRGRLWVSCDRSNEERVMWAAYLATRVFPVLAELETS